MRDKSFIDYVLLGEYEFTTKELIEKTIQGQSLKDIKGIGFRQGDEIIINKRRPLIEDLNSLPFPDRSDFPSGRYHDFAFYSPCISIVASRGCPSACSFCTERHIIYNSPRYRKRNPICVVDEMKQCIDEFKAKQFYFDDMSLTVDRGYVQAICDEMMNRGIKVPWTCMGDAMFIDYETLVKMKKAGCIGMKFGVES